MNRMLCRDVVSVLVLLLVTTALYGKITRLWWTYDDAYLIRIATVHPAADHFVGGSIWRAMPQQLFTPLLTATYDSQLALFGVVPKPYYAVHLALIVAAAVALYAALRLWLTVGPALSGAILFAAGAPLCNVATQLMLVHYVESVVLGIVSASMYVVAQRRGSAAYAIGSSVFYLAAMLAKEVAVPLIAILLFITPRHQRRHLIPHAVVLAGYAVWRWSALGTLFGGYGWAIEAIDIPRLLLLTPIRTLGVFAGPERMFGVVLIIATAAGMVALCRSRRTALVVIVAIALSIAPTLPAAKEMQKRFAFVPWLSWSVLFAAGAASMERRRLREALLIVAPLLALAVNRLEWRDEFARAERMSDEGRLFFNLGAGDLLRKPLIPPAAMGELKWLKEDYLRRNSGTLWFYDDLFLCSTPTAGKRIFEYTRENRVADVTQRVASYARTYCASLRHAPLSARFRYENGALRWQFGPYQSGRYSVVIANGLQAFEVPSRDAFRLTGVEVITMRVRYEAPAAWVTYSPELTIPLQEGREIAWRR